MKKFSKMLTLLLVLIFSLSFLCVLALAEETPSKPEFVDPVKGERRLAYLSTRRYLGVLADVDIKDDNTISFRADSIDWTNNSLTYLYQWTVPGNGIRFSYFVGYAKPVTVNELIIGDITHWIKDEYKDDLETLMVYSAIDPNGTWTKIETTNVRYNCDEELSGTYNFGGIRLLFDEPVTAYYFMIVDTDVQSRRLWLSGNTMAAVCQGEVEEETLPVTETTAAETTQDTETTEVVTKVDDVNEPDEETAVSGSPVKDNDTVLYGVIGAEAVAIVALAALLVVKKKKN